jgi:2-oxo-4-hydroxy-4-carboxy--5-ureidoimidazoline (OHCU) decarboxylase
VSGGTLPPIPVLNRLSRMEFLAVLRPLFEGGEVLGARLWKERPFAGYDELIDRAERLSADLAEQEKVGIVNSHPRLGESAAALERLSRLSRLEQGYGSPELPEEGEARERLWRLNGEYEARHGFRFVTFVNRRPPSELAGELEQRLGRRREDELAAALAAVFAIARDRLARLGRDP